MRRTLITAVSLLAFAAGGFGHEPEPTAAQLTAMEEFISQPATRVVWSGEAGRIAADGSAAVFTAIVAENGTRRMRGIEIALSTQQATADKVYVSVEFFERLLGALDDASMSAPTVRGCMGSGKFLTAMRAGAHFFFASQCNQGGVDVLQVGTGHGFFFFPNLNPAPVADAIRQAKADLKER
jgi:hypothetical protein